MVNNESNPVSIETIEQAITNLNSLNVYIDKNEEIKNLKIKSQNNELVISVMGAMKSGKSTFINSLIGCDLMPNENAACTFTTTELLHGKSNNVEIKKIFHGRTEIIKGNSIEETASLFHDDVKKNRITPQERFKYTLTYPLCGIKKKEPKDNFVIVDTPGLNEMSGLGVEKSEIQTLFGKVLKRTDYIFFIIDYQYYKAEENAAILDEIKIHRKEIIENNNIVFVLNKIDAQTEKDGSIDHIFDDVSSVLNSWGVVDPKLYPISAKKALYSRLIQNDMSIDEEDLKRFIIPVEKKISDKIFFFLPQKSKSQAAVLMKDSNLLTFENDVLLDLYINANEYAAKTIKELSLSIADEVIKNTDNKINEIEELLKPILLRKMELNNAHSKIKEINSLITSKAQDFTKNISEKIQKSRNEVTYIPECDMRYSSAKTFTWYDIKYTSKAKNYYKVTSESSAENTGKNEYYYWTDKIKVPWEKIYVHYSEKLRYDNDNSNMFYLINTNACAILKELENKTNGLLKDLDCRDSLSFMSNINIDVLAKRILALTI